MNPIFFLALFFSIKLYGITYLIDQPGTYNLGIDISEVGTNVIQIAANNVTLDLGHHIVSGGTVGITINPGLSFIVISNGVIENNSVQGLFIDSCENITINNVDFTGNGTGIFISTSTDIAMTNCICCTNKASGIVIDNSNTVQITQCEVIANLENGIQIINSSTNSKITQNFILRNGTLATHAGIILDTIINHDVFDNTCNNNQIGISANQATGLACHNNQVNDNNSNGISIQNSKSGNFINNFAINNGSSGISVASSNNLVVANNTTNDNSLEGIFLSACQAIELDKNTSFNNASNGIEINSSFTILVINNVIKNNSSDGLRVPSSTHCSIESNQINGNTAGITFLTGTRNTVKNNVCSDNSGSDGIFLNASSTNNYFSENITNFNVSFGIRNLGGTTNSFFNNDAQQNGTNFSGVTIIAVFSAGIFITPPITAFDNISII